MKVEKSKIMFGRFVITDEVGNLTDDANGFGYKSYRSGVKAMWYKYGGGKAKIDATTKGKRKLMKEHPGLEDYIEELYMYSCKGEYTKEDFIAAIKEKFGIDMPKAFL